MLSEAETRTKEVKEATDMLEGVTIIAPTIFCERNICGFLQSDWLNHLVYRLVNILRSEDTLSAYYV